MLQHKFQRADKGMKRKSTRAALVATPNDAHLSSAIPAGLDPKTVLDAYLAAPSTSGLAEQFGVKRSTLTWWLRETCPNEWRRVQQVRALLRKEQGDEGIDTSHDALSLARAREQLRSGQWDLERLCEEYRPQQQVDMSVSGPVISFTIAQPEPKPQDVVFEQISEPIATIKTDAS